MTGHEGNTSTTDHNGDSLAVDQHIDETITGLLGRIMDGTCRPLKVRCVCYRTLKLWVLLMCKSFVNPQSRIEQVLISQPGSISSYKIANIIQFYTITIGKLFSSNASLPELLNG
jgi:hypothetical protein